jgi:hypothetical protein
MKLINFNRWIFLGIFLLIYVINLGSYTILLPTNSDDKFKSFFVPVPDLKGYHAAPDSSPNLNGWKKSLLEEDASKKVEYQTPKNKNTTAKFALQSSGTEDDVDTNDTNVDGLSDIGSETNFTNSQGFSTDSKFMSIQEGDTSSPQVLIDEISSNSGNANSFAHTHNVSGNNRFLIVSIQTENGTSVASLTYAGISLNFEVSHSYSNEKLNVEIWSLINPPIGSADVIATLSGGKSDKTTIGVVSYTEVDQVVPIDDITARHDNSDSPSITIASKPGDLVQDAMASLSNGPPSTVSEGQIQRWSKEMGGPGSSSHYGVGSTKPGAASVALKWSLQEINDWVIIGFNIRKAPSIFELDLEYQWISADYTKLKEELAIYTGSLGEENLKVDVWSGGTWIEILPTLAENAWNNVSISNYLLSSIFTIRLRDTSKTNDSFKDTWNIDLILIHTWALNHVPTATNLTLSPDPLYSNGTLSLNYEFFDQDNDTESKELTEIRWMKWNETISQWNMVSAYDQEVAIPSSALFKGNTWQVSVKPHDGKEFGNLAISSNVTVQNTPPLASNLVIFPSSPKTGNDLVSSYNWVDPDVGDVETNTLINWYRDNGSGFILQTSYTNQTTILSSHTRKNDYWKYHLTPSDGEDIGLIQISPSIRIENTPPTLIITINNFTQPAEVGIDIDLVANYSYFDSDNQDHPTVDSLNTSRLEVRWLKFNSTSESFEVVAYDTFVISNTLTSNNDLWRCEMNVSDDTDYSGWYSSATITVEASPNNPPSAINVNLSLSSPVAAGHLNISYTFVDPDGDNESASNYRWFKNCIHQSQFDGIRHLVTAQFVKGDIWCAEVKPCDEFGDYGNWTRSDNITIVNTAPEVTTTEIFPEIAFTTSTLVATYEFTDIDNDQITKIRIIWLKDSIEVPILENITEIPSTFTQKGEVWTYLLWLYDETNWSLPKSPLPGVYIQNSKPNIGNITLTGGSSTNDDIILSYDFIDADEDTESSETKITWKIFHRGTIIPNTPTSKILPRDWFTAGDFIFCLIQPSDGEDLGTLVDSTSYPKGYLVVGNSAPELVGPPVIMNSNGSTSISASLSLKVTYTVFDPDHGESDPIYDIEIDQNGYVIGAKYRWYKNGALIHELIDSYVEKRFLQKGDMWICSVQPRDRYGTFGSWVNSTEIIINNALMVILDLWIENQNTRITVTETTYANASLFVNYLVTDADNDIQTDFKILWYWDFGNGSFILRTDFGNNTISIHPSGLFKDQAFYIELCVTDGEDWSNWRKTSVIEIINSPPLISSWNYLFELKPSQVKPEIRTNEFYVDNEDLTISYDFVDIDNDKDKTKIQWYKKLLNGSWLELNSFENQTDIPSTETYPGELWYCTFTAYDGMEFGTQINTSHIPIESKPIIINTKSNPDINMDAKYNITTQVIDVRNPVVYVEFEILIDNSSFERNSSMLEGNFWTVSISFGEEFGYEYINSTIKIFIHAVTNVLGTNFYILCYSVFNLTIQDEVPPRILDVHIIPDNVQNPSSFTFYAEVEELGSEIKEVFLFYSFIDNSTFVITGMSSISVLQNESRIEMELLNTSATRSFYLAKIKYDFKSGMSLYYRIQTRDDRGNINENAYIDEVDLNISLNGRNFWEIIPLVILTSFISVGTVLSVLIVRNKHRKHRKKMIEKEMKIGEKFSDLFSLRAILIRNRYGLPLHSMNFTTTSSDSSLLAGLSSAISEFVSYVSQRSIKEGEFDTLERSKFNFLSYHGKYIIISAISKEKLSSYMKDQLRSIVLNVESTLLLEELDSELTTDYKAQIQCIIDDFLPLGFIYPLMVDYSNLESLSKHLRKDERKLLKYLIEIPSFIEHQQVFYVTSFVSSLTAHKVSLLKVLSFLEHCYDLGIIRNYSP